jgi:hypothetical protein
MPRAKRHDLSELPYSPTIWQRIGGPWSITLRAYLWTAPLAILTQPLVEPSFWNDYGNWPTWFLISVWVIWFWLSPLAWLGLHLLIGAKKLIICGVSDIYCSSCQYASKRNHWLID